MEEATSDNRIEDASVRSWLIHMRDHACYDVVLCEAMGASGRQPAIRSYRYKKMKIYLDKLLGSIQACQTTLKYDDLRLLHRFV